MTISQLSPRANLTLSVLGKRTCRTLLTIYCLSSAKILFAEEVLPPRLKITSDVEEAADSAQDDGTQTRRAPRWQTSCKAFGKYLSRNKGLFGTGPFIDIKCPIKSKKGNSYAVDDSDYSLNEVESQWHLNFKQLDNSLKVTMTYTGAQKPFQVLSILLETDVAPSALLSNPAAAPLLAAEISFTMPFASTFKSDNVYGFNNVSPQNESLKNLGNLLGDMTIFELIVRKKRWVPNILGTLRGGKELPKENAEEAKTANFSDSKFTYLFGQIQNQRPAVISKLHELLVREVESIDSPNQIGRGVLVGARYGLSINSVDPILSKASMVSVLLESRSGIFEGLRLNFDSIPEIKVVDESGTRQFSSSRYQLGYAFSIYNRKGLIDWIDITPRLGFTNLVYEIHTRTDALVVDQSFRQNRAPTVGAELGIEKRSSYVLLRGWLFGTYSVGFLPVDKLYSTKSIRAGLDFYKHVFKIGSLGFTALAFGAIDSTSINKKVDDETSTDSDPNSLSTLTMKTYFLGGGIVANIH